MIDGDRIRLRAIEPEDAERLFRWINDREVTRTLAARYPYSLAWEKEWAAGAAKEQSFSEVRFAIETKDGVHIGVCGIHNGRPEDRNCDLGILIGEKEYWNQGLGTDVMRTVLRFAFHQMNMHKVSLGVFEINPRAFAVYTKVGFVEEGRRRQDYYQDGQFWDVIWMSVLRTEFDALHSSADTPLANPIASA